MNPLVIVMDLGNTILDHYEIDFYKGFLYIYDTYCLHDVSFDSLKKDIEIIYNEAYKKRDNDDFEVNFHNYLRYISKTVVFKENVDFYKLEQVFLKHAFKSSIVDGVKEFLEYVKKLNIDIYILSNSCFSSEGLKYELRNFGLLDYFKDVISSSEYILRKPNRLFFNVICKHLSNNYKNIDLKKVWYIGNDYNYDVVGAYNAGLKAVWLNRLNLPNIDQLPIMDVPSYYFLVDYLRRINHDKI